MFSESRYNILVRRDSGTESRKTKRTIHHFVNYLLTTLVFTTTVFDMPSASETCRIFMEKLPCVPTEILDRPGYTMLGNLYTVRIIIPMDITICFIQIIAFFYSTWSHISNTKSQSHRTTELQKSFFKALLLQIMFPFCIPVYRVFQLGHMLNMRMNRFLVYYIFIGAIILPAYYLLLTIKFFIFAIFPIGPFQNCEEVYLQWYVLIIPINYFSKKFGEYVEQNTKNLTTIEFYENQSDQVVVSHEKIVLRAALKDSFPMYSNFIICSLYVSCNPWLFWPSFSIALLIFYHFVTSSFLPIFYYSLFTKFIIFCILYNPPIEKCELLYSKWGLLAIPLYFSSYQFEKYVERNSKNLTTLGSYEKRSNQIIISQYEMILKENLSISESENFGTSDSGVAGNFWPEAGRLQDGTWSDSGKDIVGSRPRSKLPANF
ncbi:Protein CBG04954 [Caenorhabditis briggsae]|uniref:Protein CBG04954 n=1 Tax=Caenorhabditis briggsae TaxID=6238 RepID=A8WYW0_CAEBR|nr:Protein CBG04954 [Caenorhabditis briggsae]CAP25568.1 Protein CBG04954 [Caenorhabditis briggsae]